MVLIKPKVAFQIIQVIILVFCQAYKEKCVDSLKVSLFQLQVSRRRKILVRMQREKNIVSFSNGLNCYIKERCLTGMCAFTFKRGSCDFSLSINWTI